MPCIWATYFWADHEPVLFDALAFNDALRRIDTIGDLAFTFMDLHARGLPRLAWRFIGTALEACGDQEALPLLAWWAVYRAAVRAKVVLLGAAGSGAAAAQALSRRYLEVALHLAGLASRPAKPRLVQMFSLSGAGKCRIAGLLVERLAAGVGCWGGPLGWAAGVGGWGGRLGRRAAAAVGRRAQALVCAGANGA